MYKENPKMAGSGILPCIPQTGRCPNGCADCFFQSGRSYLEPLEENLPNIPPVKLARNRVVKMNDGNDSNVQRKLVERVACRFPMHFFNTAIPKDLDKFDAPVVLTINPGQMTDVGFVKLDKIPRNLMFVRFRVNAWNTEICEKAVVYYALRRQTKVCLTFMAYYRSTVPIDYRLSYEWRKRTVNSYWCASSLLWQRVAVRFADSHVFTCGQDSNLPESTLPESTLCRHCGGCLREYFATVERMRRT